MNDLTLVVMAAGMGSRFGGLKQLAPVDEDGNFIIDYSVFDAKRAGFNKVIFVIKEENRELFESTIGSRLKNIIDVDYVHQSIDDIPVKVDISNRVKPWGTVQAVLASKDKVSGDFLVINSDDFYGYDAYDKAIKFFINERDNNTHACISYPFDKTVWGSEEVKRGVIVEKDGVIVDFKECKISLDDDLAHACPLNGEDKFDIFRNQLVSMNMFAFKRSIYSLLEDYFIDFLMNDNILEGEALLSDALKKYITNGNIVMKSIGSDSSWLGMTYRDDLIKVKESIC